MEQNQPIQGNFGGVFNTATPNLDRVAQQFEQQYTDRKAYLQKESESTDNLLTKEMANIRSVDTSDIIDAYSKYKSAKQYQLFNKSIQQNPKLYAAAQMDANAKYADVMSMINKSKQYNDFGKNLANNRLSKPDAYSDETGNMLSTFYKTPMSQLTAANYNGKSTDLTNLDNYRYQGGNYDFAKLHTTAVGKPVTHYDNGTTDASGLQTTQHGYQYGNTPGQYREVYIGGLATNQAHRGALYAWSQRDPQEVSSLDAAYQNSPNWQKLGIPPQPLPPYNPNDPAGNEATYQAKKYLVEMNPAEVKAATQTNQAAKMNLQAKNSLNRQEVMEAIKQGNREKLVGIKHAYKEADIKEQSSILNDTYNSIVGDADTSKPHYYMSPDRKTTVKLSPIKISASLQAAFAPRDDKGHPIYPSYVGITDDGKYIYPIYHSSDEETDNKKDVNAALSRPITSAEFKALLGKTYFGVREAAKENSTPGGAPKKTIDGF